MPTEKEKPKVKIVYRDRPAPPPPPSRSLIHDTLMPMLKKDHNWKIVLGIAIGYLIKVALG